MTSYRETWMVEAGTFNISGWNSSYTDGPIAAEEMRRWLDGTVEAILAHRPQRVLELGCGNGLVLFRVAPHCERYVGCDFSEAVLDHVLRNLEALGDASQRVILRRQRADDFTGIEHGAFDTVVLNSVVHGFPSADYLLRVLEGAIGAVARGGRIFVGDVRNRSLFRAFHASVQAYRAAPELPTAELRQRVERHLDQDCELVVEPGMFAALNKLFPRISAVTVRPKPGGYDNELSRFRYDVTLHLDEPAAALPAVRWIDWSAGQPSLEALERELARSEPDVLGVREVPNARVLVDCRTAEILDGERCPPTTRELLAEAGRIAGGLAVDPDELLAISERLPYRVELDWASSSPSGAFDVLFVRRDGDSTATGRPFVFPRATPRTRSWASYTNDPLHGRRRGG
jgi:SAM-dependent methyltransferase